MEPRNRTDICLKIQFKRDEMIQHAKNHGMADKKTLRASEELDLLINEYLHIQMNELWTAQKAIQNGQGVIHSFTRPKTEYHPADGLSLAWGQAGTYLRA